MKRLFLIVFTIALFVISMPLVGAAADSTIYIENVDYPASGTDQVLVPVKLNALPLTAPNGEKGSYGAGIVFVTFDQTRLEYVGTKTGTMESAKGKTITWRTNDPDTANQNGEIRLAFVDETPDRAKSYGEGSFGLNSRDTILYLEFAVKKKTVGDKIPVNITRAELAGNAAPAIPSLIGGSTLDMAGGSINITASVTPPTPGGGSGGGGGGGGGAGGGGAVPKTPIPDPIPVPVEQPEVQPEPLVLTDIAGHWAEGSILELVGSGAVKGYPDGSFKPDAVISRAEFASILVNALGLTPQKGRAFDDTIDHWAKDSINTAESYGIVTGFDSETFGPDLRITREQMALMVARTKEFAVVSGDITFKDDQDISGWAREAVITVVKAGIMVGYPDNSFKPQGKTTRAEAATVILKISK